MSKIRHCKIDQIPAGHKCEHEGYEYFRRKFVPFGAAENTHVCVYEIPPGKAAYPYHYHCKTEETFYIISGIGTLRTPEGEKQVAAGELIFFPAGEAGAHKLTNASDTENLVYLDFDVTHELDVAVYPDSDKIGIWGMGINQIFPKSADVDYYHGE
jgi:uncharacterized cupin superfamily protein